MLEVGTQAPDFTTRNHRGEEVRLSALRGRPVVLWFFPKADTPGCTAQGCGMRDAISRFEEKEVAVFGVSYDSVEDNRAFAEKFDFPFDLLCDTERQIGELYQAGNECRPEYADRVTYVIDAEGKIAATMPKVKPATHADEVLALLG